MSITATGCCGVRRSGETTTLPPHRSATALKPGTLEATSRRVATARARPDDADLAVAERLRLDPVHGLAGVAFDGLVGDATGGARGGGDVVGRAVPEAFVEVRHDGDVAVFGEAACELAVELVPAGRVVGHDDARVGPVTVRACDVRVDLVALVALAAGLE